MLSTLALGLPRGVLEEPQLFAVKAIDLRQGTERYYQRHYINMDRRKFDSWLLSLVPSSVEVRTNCRFVSYDCQDAGFTLQFTHDGAPITERARILIGADGANSRVRRQLRPTSPLPTRYIAIQEWVERDHCLPYFTSLFDREITDYYAWTIPKQNHRLIGAALRPGPTAPAKFELLKDKLRRCGLEFGRTLHREGAFIVRPTTRVDLCTGAKGIALLGEAAGWISPSSAEGFSYAFRSALLLDEALRAAPKDFEKHYHRKTAALRRNILLKNWKSRVVFNPTLRKAIMKSGIQSVKVIEP
jgi:flavin-dependent dehydrogenase